MKSISKEYFLFLIRTGSGYEGYVDDIGFVSCKKTWHPYFFQQNRYFPDHYSFKQGYTVEITPGKKQESYNKESIENQTSIGETIIENIESAWEWMKEHFDFRGEYELSVGAQVAGGVKKAGYAEVNLHSYVMQNLSYSSKTGFGEPIFQEELDISKPQVITRSIGAAYYAGAEISSRTEVDGHTTYTFSIGAFCIGGEVSWDSNGIQDWFWGVDLTAKAAVAVGLMLNLKLGFSK